MADVDRERARRVFEERARILARPLRPEEPDGIVEMIVMSVGSERYGVDGRSVREVVERADVTPVPGTPAFWSGIVNVRGTLHPVLDLRRYLSLADGAAAGSTTTVVLVSGAGLTAGILVDDAPELRRLPGAAVGPPLGGTPDTVHRVARGVTEDLLTVLDVEALLADPRLAVREESHDDPT